MKPSVSLAEMLRKLSLLIFSSCLLLVCALGQRQSGSQAPIQSDNTAGPQPASGVAGQEQELQAYGQTFNLQLGDTWATQADGTVLITHLVVANRRIDHQSYKTRVQPPALGMQTTSTTTFQDGRVSSAVGAQPNGGIAVFLNPTGGGFNYEFFVVSGHSLVTHETGFV